MGELPLSALRRTIKARNELKFKLILLQRILEERGELTKYEISE
jgi:hypothetical protein